MVLLDLKPSNIPAKIGIKEIVVKIEDLSNPFNDLTINDFDFWIDSTVK